MNRETEIGPNLDTTVCILAALAVIAIVSIVGCTETERSKRVAYENGLHEVQNTGEQGTHFEKK